MNVFRRTLTITLILWGCLIHFAVEVWADSDKTSDVGVDKEGHSLPKGAIYRFGNIRFRPGARVYESTLSGDGRRLATLCDYHCAVWDAASGQRLRVFQDFEIRTYRAKRQIALS